MEDTTNDRTTVCPRPPCLVWSITDFAARLSNTSFGENAFRSAVSKPNERQRIPAAGNGLIIHPSHDREGALSTVFSVAWDRRLSPFGSNGSERRRRYRIQTPHEPFRKAGAGPVLAAVPG